MSDFGIGVPSEYARQTVSESVARKGARLHRDGLVAEGPTLGSFRVKGDHGFYRVTIFSVDEFGVNGMCDCPSRRPCSHLFASVLLAAERDLDLNARIASDDPFAGIV